MKDDILAQIQQAEQKALQLLEDSRKRGEEGLISYEAKLVSDGDNSLSKDRQKAHDKIAEKQIEGREVYEQRVKEGSKAVASLEKGVEEKVEKLYPALEAYFLGELV